jgi:hypothetical protein
MAGAGGAFFARVGGLVIHADVPLDGVRPLATPEKPDVRVRMRGSNDAPPMNAAESAWYVSPYRDDHDVPLLTIQALGSGHLLQYAEGTRFSISGSGSEVDAWWDEPLTAVDATDYLLGAVLAFVVRLRGAVPLHASAVVIGDHAVLFAGPAGAGKSSLAAALAILGYPVLSDDLVVIDESNGQVHAYPSQARISLWPDAADGLFSAISLPAHSAVYAKRRLDLSEHGYRFHEGARQVATMCMLMARDAASDPPAMRMLRPQEALMTLVSHTYGNYLLDGSMRAREFDVLGRVAAAVPVAELTLRAGFDALVADGRKLAERLALESAAL